jgi:hypothetical protein
MVDELGSGALEDEVATKLELETLVLLEVVGILELLSAKLALDIAELIVVEALVFEVFEATHAPRLQAPISKRLICALRRNN